MYDILTQAVGFAAMALCVGCLQFRRSRSLILCQLAGSVLYVIHYFMLGAYSGCVSMAILSCSNLLLGLRERPRAAWGGWKWLFSAMFAAACAFTWENAFSLLPCAASVAAILTNWSYNGRTIRLGKLLLVGPGWVVYNVYVRSCSGIACEVVGMRSALVSICRYGLKELDNAR